MLLHGFSVSDSYISGLVLAFAENNSELSVGNILDIGSPAGNFHDKRDTTDCQRATLECMSL